MIRKLLKRKKLNPLISTFTGIKYEEKLSIQLFEYNENSYVERIDILEKEFKGFHDLENKYWLNVYGIHDVEQITSLCNKLGVHNLVIQDILDVNQRPKFQVYEKYLFFSIKSILPSNDTEIKSEQLSFILGKNFLVSFQERRADHFEHIRHRIRGRVGILCERSTDYLLFLLFESILDNYFKTVDDIEIKTEKFGVIEMDINPSPIIFKTIKLLKNHLYQIRKTIIPVKEFVTKIEREEFELIHQKHIKYFFELKDLCLTLMDSCDRIEVKLESSINLFFSVQGNIMNQVMKTLTVVATIFIPLTFIVGVYGMNFDNMPELTWTWGYLVIWVIIVIVFVGMIIYFKMKRWF